MTLLEISMAITIISLLILDTGQSFSKWKTCIELSAHHHTLGQLLSEARWTCLSKDIPSDISITTSQCRFTNTNIPPYPLPSNITSTISNSNGMGFSDNGSTAKAATLKLKTSSIEKQITLSVGYGMIRIK